MMNSLGKFILLAVLLGHGCAQDSLIWSKEMRRERASNIVHIDQTLYKYGKTQNDLIYSHNQRERELTTKRPSSASAQNDDEMYDSTEQNNPDIKIQNYPYSSHVHNADQLTVSNAGFAAIQPANGILVGPGGPTGVIGRPQQQYPDFSVGIPLGAGAAFIGQDAQSGFQVGQGQIHGFQGVIGGPQYSTQANTGMGQFSPGQFPQAVSATYPQNGQFLVNGQFPGYYFPGQYTTGPYSSVGTDNRQRGVQNTPSQFISGPYGQRTSSFSDGYDSIHSSGSAVGQPISQFKSGSHTYAYETAKRNKSNSKGKDSKNIDKAGVEKAVDDKINTNFKIF